MSSSSSETVKDVHSTQAGTTTRIFQHLGQPLNEEITVVVKPTDLYFSHKKEVGETTSLESCVWL